MKKIFACLLILCMLSVVFCACNEDTTDGVTAGQDTIGEETIGEDTTGEETDNGGILDKIEDIIQDIFNPDSNDDKDDTKDSESTPADTDGDNITPGSNNPWTNEY